MVLNGKVCIILILLMQQISAGACSVKICPNSAGHTKNSEKCTCGETPCEQGKYCLFNQCNPMCEFGKVITSEKHGCYCGTKANIKCEDGMFCDPSDSAPTQMFCYRQCTGYDGTERCEEPCGCGQELCKKDQFCHEDHCEEYPICTAYPAYEETQCACKDNVDLTAKTKLKNVCEVDQFCYYGGCHQYRLCVESSSLKEPCVCVIDNNYTEVVCKANEYCFPGEPKVCISNLSECDKNGKIAVKENDQQCICDKTLCRTGQYCHGIFCNNNPLCNIDVVTQLACSCKAKKDIISSGAEVCEKKQFCGLQPNGRLTCWYDYSDDYWKEKEVPGNRIAYYQKHHDESTHGYIFMNPLAFEWDNWKVCYLFDEREEYKLFKKSDVKFPTSLIDFENNSGIKNDHTHGRPKFIFVLSPKKNLYVAGSNRHSCFLNGGPVLAAGEFTFDEDGTNVKLSNASGHYKPDFECMVHVIQWFFDNGLKTENMKDWICKDESKQTNENCMRLYDRIKYEKQKSSRDVVVKSEQTNIGDINISN